MENDNQRKRAEKEKKRRSHLVKEPQRETRRPPYGHTNLMETGDIATTPQVSSIESVVLEKNICSGQRKNCEYQQ